MSAYKVSYRVFTVHAICKTQLLYIYTQRDIQHKSRYTHAIYVERSMLQSWIESRYIRDCLTLQNSLNSTGFWNKLCTNATHFLNRVFNISESRFEGYPVRKHDCTCASEQDSDIFSWIHKHDKHEWIRIWIRYFDIAKHWSCIKSLPFQISVYTQDTHDIVEMIRQNNSTWCTHANCTCNKLLMNPSSISTSWDGWVLFAINTSLSCYKFTVYTIISSLSSLSAVISYPGPTWGMTRGQHACCSFGSSSSLDPGHLPT